MIPLPYRIFNRAGHGTMMFYTEDESAEHRWYHVDTTSTHDGSISRPEDALSHREDIWSPFRSIDSEQPGFHKGIGSEHYHNKMTVARNSLLSMVTNAANTNEFAYSETFMTAEWMDSAYDHIRNGGGIDPILNPVEEVIDHQIQTGEYVGIYGSSLDDTRVVAGDLRNLHDDVMMNPDATLTADQVENRLEGATA